MTRIKGYADYFVATYQGFFPGGKPSRRAVEWITMVKNDLTKNQWEEFLRRIITLALSRRSVAEVEGILGFLLQVAPDMSARVPEDLRVEIDRENERRKEREKRDQVEEAEKIRREAELAQLRQERDRDERERSRQEEMHLTEQRREAEARRAEVLSALRKVLADDYMRADFFFEVSCAQYISSEDYKREIALFAQGWIKEATGTELDIEQAVAVASVHGDIQVIARAGSGKTTTLVNRAIFLQKHCGVAPSEMLLLAFNRKAALEMRRRLLGLLSEGAEAAVAADVESRLREVGKHKRINRDEIEANAVNALATTLNVTLPHVMTFHALARAIVFTDLYKRGIQAPDLIVDHDFDRTRGRVFQQVIDDHLQVPAFKEQIRELMLAHFREDWDRIVEGCYDKSKEELLQFRRSLPRESLGGEDVKSRGEKVIADFLFEHDIAYKYEHNHWWSGINYQPDFTIFQTAKSGTIIEYFGLKGDADYDEMSEEKRAYWDTKQGWTLIDFSPHDIVVNGADSFLALLKKRLEDQGIPCVRLTEDEIWHRVRDRAVDRFSVATVNFVGKCRNRSLSPSQLRSLIDCYSPLSSVEGMFLNLAHRLYVAYLDRLSATGEEDFEGLMQRAADAIIAGQTLFERKSGSGDLALLRYVCIDEFQDFSDLFYRLLNAIRKQNPRIELFCVGDDWQAINGFAGSDLRFFENFADYIGESRRLYISTNYRSSNAIVAIGNALMEGLGKPAITHKKSAGKVLVSDLDEFEPSLLEKQRHSGGDDITPAVLRLVNKGLSDGLDVVILNRTNHLNWYVENFEAKKLDGFLESIRSFFPKGLKERITISTVHKYKGLERPMVILLDVVARSYPLIHPDWAFSRVLGDSPEKITKEERRLLYVALTRAIEKLVIVTNGRSKSPFLEELERRHSLCAVNWEEYPSIRALTNRRLVVRVKNQVDRNGGGSYEVKDLLLASRYSWHSVRKYWEKSFPMDGFSIEAIKAEVWTELADGIEVGIFDDTETLAARFLIMAGKWNCVVDQLATLSGEHSE